MILEIISTSKRVKSLSVSDVTLQRSLRADVYPISKLDVHGSMHHNINLTEITNKMRPCSRIYYSTVS